MTTSVFGPYYAMLSNVRKLLQTQNAQNPVDDERIFYYIAEASQLVEDFCGQNFDERWMTYGFNGEIGLNNATLSLHNRPLLSLNSVTNGDGNIISNTNVTVLPFGSLFPKYDIRLNPGNYWRSLPSVPNCPPFPPLLDYSYAEDAIHVYGSWGFHRRYPNAYQPTNLTLGSSMDAVQETLVLSGPMNTGRYGMVDVGSILLVDTEQIAIVGPFGDTLRGSITVNVVRGYNNTTAAGHNSAAPISTWIPEPTVVQAVALGAAAQYAREINPTDDQVTLANYGTFTVQRNALPSKVKNMLGSPLYNFVWGAQA